MDQQQRTDLLTKLGAEVEGLRDSDRWAQWLRTASKFRRYSFHNQLLIAAQRPDATYVAGYRAWQQLGRQVQRGERSISILAPVVRKVTDESDGKEKRGVVGFRVARVFDVSQTAGEPLETIAEAHQNARLTTEVGGPSFDQLATVARSLGVSVELTSERHPLMSNAHGWFTPADRSITVRDEGAGPAVLTLLHELGHALDPDCKPGAEQCRTVGEVVAQSVAYLVGQSIGIDLGEVSAVYLASWDGDTKAIEGVAKKVLDIVARLETALGSVTNADEVAA